MTIEPYFDSTNGPSPNVTFEVSPGRVVGATEFLTLFSNATIDQSVLPPAGTLAPASGANFSNTSVEPLGTPDRPEALGPLPLLSQGFVPPNWNANFADPTLLRDAAFNLGGAGSDTGDIDTESPAIDTENPTVVVNIVDGTLSDSINSSVVTFAFSEAPGASFTESDIVVSAGLTLVAGSLTMIDATHYEATVTAVDGFTGNATVSLSAGSYTDAALNLGGAGSDSVSIDTENPTVTVDIVDPTLNSDDNSSVVTFAFSEAPGASFTESDIQVSAGLTLVAGSLTMVDATHYTATVTADDGFIGTGTVSVAAGSYTDAALNLGRRRF